MTEPTPEIDKRLESSLTADHRGRWVVLTAVIVLLTAGLGALGYTTVVDARQLHSSCRFYHDIATAPVVISGPAATGRLGVSFIADARHAYDGQECGTLPDPSPALRQLAGQYGIPLP